MNNYYNPRLPIFRPHAGGADAIVIALGAAGYIDTDCTTPLGDNRSKLWLIVSRGLTNTNATQMGARAPGEVVDISYSSYVCIFLSYAGANGHMDLYRNAAQNVGYYFVGYFD